MKLKLTALLVLCGALAAPAAETEEGFKSIFNGKDLSGWEGHAEIWSVKDGAITGVTKAEPKLTHNTFLVYTNGEVSDFELRLSYRIVNGNSGIQYRSKVLRQGQFGPIVGGYQADFEAGKRYSGILYEEQGRGILAQRGQKTVVQADGDKPKIEVTGSVGDSDAIQGSIKNEDWNDYVVIAKGNHLQHFINGKQTVDVTDEVAAKAAKSGVLALQAHTGPPMTVQFKTIRIQALSSVAPSGAEPADGVWEVASMEANGEALPSETYDGLKLTVTGAKYSANKDGEIDRGTFSVDASKSPKQMDIRPEIGPGAGRTILAIYEFTGKDVMRVCYAVQDGASRPKDFRTEQDSGEVLIHYKRK
jgi:uncharacterized protein (TIGR03067 family)